MNPIEIACILISYLVGAIPFGVVLSMHSGVDIRSEGSRNIGATNVGRLLGKKMGALTLLADIAKGFLPMFLAAQYLPDTDQKNLAIALCGAATVLGHMFPVYLAFKGGKGVATALGVFLFLAPKGVLFCLAVFAATVSLSGYVSVGSLLGALSVIPVLLFFKEPHWKLVLAVFVVVLIWVKHHQNISRLLRGEEKSWKRKDE